jgi:hypothetical protein
MNNNRKVAVASLGILALLIGVGGGLGSVFAWHIVSFSTTPSTTSSAIGTSISDSAKLQLSDNGGPYGSITFKIYSGTCTTEGVPTGTLKYTSSPVPVTSAATSGSGATYGSGPVSTTGLAAGSYVWVASYSGTAGGYPAGTAGCESFTLFKGSPPPVPEFPLGIALLMALAIPALLLVRSKRSALLPQGR